MSNNNQHTFYRKKVAFRLVLANSDSGSFVGLEAANVKEETLSQENPNYDWENKVFFSLNISEIGSIINLLKGVKSEYNSFHTTSKGSKTLKMRRMENGNILFQIEHSDKSTGNTIKINSCSIQVDDIPVLLVLLEEFIKTLFYNQ